MSVSTVLVVEDDPLALKLFVTLVERNGYRALAAADGREALQIFSYERPHVLVLDLVMPYMSGLEVLQVVRSTPALRAMRVLVLTARPAFLSQAIALGVEGWLTKPVLASQFLAALQQVMDDLPSVTY